NHMRADIARPSSNQYGHGNCAPKTPAKMSLTSKARVETGLMSLPNGLLSSGPYRYWIATVGHRLPDLRAIEAPKKDSPQWIARQTPTRLSRLRRPRAALPACAKATS